jgi:hypothetical protein
VRGRRDEVVVLPAALVVGVPVRDVAQRREQALVTVGELGVEARSPEVSHGVLLSAAGRSARLSLTSTTLVVRVRSTDRAVDGSWARRSVEERLRWRPDRLRYLRPVTTTR